MKNIVFFTGEISLKGSQLYGLESLIPQEYLHWVTMGTGISDLPRPDQNCVCVLDATRQGEFSIFGARPAFLKWVHSSDTYYAGGFGIIPVVGDMHSEHFLSQLATDDFKPQDCWDISSQDPFVRYAIMLAHAGLDCRKQTVLGRFNVAQDEFGVSHVDQSTMLRLGEGFNDFARQRFFHGIELEVQASRGANEAAPDNQPHIFDREAYFASSLVQAEALINQQLDKY